MPVCAYCGCNSQLTREHLFPKGVDALLLDEEDGHYFLERSPNHFTHGEPIIFKPFVFAVLIIHPKAPFKIFQQFCSDFLKASPHAVLFNPNRLMISAEAHLDTVDALENHIVHNSDAYFGEPWKRFEQTQVNRKK